MLLILVSRYIEQRAWNAGTGTLRSVLQRLSRLVDELGTRDSRRPTSTSTPGRAYRDGWFVVYRPDDTETDADPSALVCLEAEPRVWEGFWTTDPDRVAAIDDAIARDL